MKMCFLERVGRVDGAVTINHRIYLKPYMCPSSLKESNLIMWNDWWKQEVEAMDGKIFKGDILLIGTEAEVWAGTAMKVVVVGRWYRTIIASEAETLSDNDMIYKMHVFDSVPDSYYIP